MTLTKTQFTPEGTGAVIRTVEDRFKEIISVKDFIPATVAPAIEDCQPYIQKAVDYLNSLSDSTSATLYFPAGRYMIKSPVDFSQDAGSNYRREIIGGDGTMAVANIIISYHGYGHTTWDTSATYAIGDEVTTSEGNSYRATAARSATDAEPTHVNGITDGWQCISAGGFYFGPTTTDGNGNEFSLSGFYFQGDSVDNDNYYRHPPAIECRGLVQSRLNNIVINTINNTALSIWSPQNNRIHNVSIWNSGRSFKYKDQTTAIASQPKNSNVLTCTSGPFTDGDKHKTIALWSSSSSNQFRQKCKIVTVNSSSEVVVDVTQANEDSAALSSKRIIFGSPFITTNANGGAALSYSNSAVLTSEVDTFAATDVGTYVWLKFASNTDIDPWEEHGSASYSVNTVVTNDGRTYRAINAANNRLAANKPTHQKLTTDVSSWVSGTTYSYSATDGGDIVKNSAGRVYERTSDSSVTTTEPTHTSNTTTTGTNGWKFLEWEYMSAQVIRRKIIGYTSPTVVTVDAAIPIKTTTTSTSGSADKFTCEIAIPALDINSDKTTTKGTGNSSDNTFSNLQIESHRGVAICADDQSLLNFSNTKLHAEQGSAATLTKAKNITAAENYSAGAMWLNQVDGTYQGSTDAQYVGTNRIFIASQTAAFILSDFITRAAQHEKIIQIDDKNAFFDGASLLIDNLSVVGANPTHGLKDIIVDNSVTGIISPKTSSPVGYLMSGSFVNQGSEDNGPIRGHITQNAYIEELGTSTTGTATRLFIGDSTNMPDENPTSGGYLYTESGALKFRGSGGAITQIGNIDTGELTIASGVITITGSYHTVDTESDAGTDNLDTINGGIAGNIVTLTAVNSARSVVLTESGNIKLGASTRTLDNLEDTITLVYNGSNWLEIAFADNGA
tara:strand:+ start:1314 stop:4013 length:2700 start_codon:yes stop_codon:yes gene_type:complete